MQYLSFTYNPKIPAVQAGTCRQTIRVTRRFKVGDDVLLFTWSGLPYRSPWGWRKQEKITEAIHVLLCPTGIIGSAPIDENRDFAVLSDVTGSTRYFYPWSALDDLATKDGIVPPSGTELGRVLTGFHAKKLRKEGVPGQIVRWTWTDNL